MRNLSLLGNLELLSLDHQLGLVGVGSTSSLLALGAGSGSRALLLLVAALNLPQVALDPARDLLLALARKDGLGEGISSRGVLLLRGALAGGGREEEEAAPTHLQQLDAAAVLLGHLDKRLNDRDVVVQHRPVDRGRAGLVDLLQESGGDVREEDLEGVCGVVSVWSGKGLSVAAWRVSSSWTAPQAALHPFHTHTHPALTKVSVSTRHVEDGVSPLVLGGRERLPAVLGGKLLHLLDLSIPAGEEDVVELLGSWCHGVCC